MVNKQESTLKGNLMTHLRAMKGYLPIRHEDVSTSGIPDISITGYNFTSWLEVKHATPSFKSPGIQELMCLRLAAAGHCRYLIYYEKGAIKRTLIIHPKHLKDLQPEAFCIGFDHEFVVDYIRQIHEHGKR